MKSSKCDKCKDKGWCWSCDECPGKPLTCILCKKTITYRGKHNHMSNLYSDPHQYVICKMCKITEFHTIDLKVLYVGFVFISVDIDLSMLKIDSKICREL